MTCCRKKTISIDYLSHTRVKNKNHAPTYYTENSHEAIIDKETFELAQRIRKDRLRLESLWKHITHPMA